MSTPAPSRPGFVHHPGYEVDIGAHVFLTSKFRRYREAAEALGLVAPNEVEIPDDATEAELLSVLRPEYLADLRGHRHTPRTMRSELPISREIIRGATLCAGGTILAVRRALERGVCIHFGGGFHHGFADHAEGFCYINDVAVAARVAIGRGWCSRIAIVDTDVHQGNGTARIFQGDGRVFTFSIHQENLYPAKEVGDLDIGLADHCGDAAYLAETERGLRVAVEEYRPDLMIYVGGVDPYIGDQLGRLDVSMEAMRARETMAFETCGRLGIPFVTLTGGGYARDRDDTIRLHLQTAEEALRAFARYRGLFNVRSTEP